jgi:hypothetical protein
VELIVLLPLSLSPTLPLSVAAIVVVRQHDAGRLGFADAACQAGPVIDHAAAALAAAEVGGQIVRRRVALGQIFLGQEMQLAAAQFPLGGDTVDCADGQVEPAQYERLRDELIERLSHIPDDKGNPIATRVFKPQEIYRACRGIPPDLLIYFGDLDWRAVGSIGHRAIHVFENDTGPDDSNHARRGIFILSDPSGKARGEQMDLQIMDCAPTLLRRFGILPPPGMGGRPIA